jgi:hypothetical protein
MKEERIDLDYVLNDFGMLDAGELNTIIGFSTVGWAAALDLKERLAETRAMDNHIRIAEGLAWIFHEIDENATSTRDFLHNLPERWKEHKAEMERLMAKYGKNKS